ncbi:histidine phosphatase family protein [candidate division WWE3 bacterium]|nr:histidine phosphatase family protein [candidate division WWE3 bacterium]
MRLFLCRHGQTTGDVEDRYGGNYDDHLTELGKQQAQQLADFLAKQDVKKLYASPLMRAQETAMVVADAIQLPVTTYSDLRERNHYGILTGMIKADALRQYPDQVALLANTHNTVEQAEPYVFFQERIQMALSEITTENASPIAIITHGGPIRLVFRELLKKGEINIEDCAIATIEYQSNTWTLIQSVGISNR